ncbi:MAG: hypothetical protein EOO10_16090 [Chitinophagaceae bacterium]|nr:MAG: hypothetical protein EOO10_16090 [Chitinophagaceae bacterium]
MKSISKIAGIYKKPGARAIAIYTFTNFFAKGASFLLLFIYTNPLYISPSENGLLNLMSTAIIFLVPFVSLGSVHSINADYFKLNGEDFKNSFTTSLVLPVLVALLSFLGLYIFRDQLNKAYGFPVSFVWIIPLIVLFNFINEHLMNLVRNANETSVFLKVNVGRTLLEIGLSVVLVVYFAWRWQGRVAGILVAYSAIFLFALYYFKKKNFLFGKVSGKRIVHELQYAGPIIIMQLSIFCLNASDKFFLSAFTADNNETVGIYSIAAIFASVITIFCTAVLHYFFPKIYSHLSGENADYSSIRKYFFMYAAIMVLCLTAMILLTPLAYKYFIHERYHSALPLVPYLCIGCFLWAINYFFYSSMLFFKERKRSFGFQHFQ